MRKCVFLMILVGCVTGVFAQQKPQYTQYIFNNYLLNPAISGIENYIDVKAGYRKQWQGLEGAPVTSFISLHAPIGKNYLYSNANSFSEAGDNPMNRSYVQTYQASEPHHGIGFHAVMDKTGPISTSDVDVTYAYHLGITERLNLSLGVAAGFSRTSVDLSKVTVQNSNDPVIASQKSQFQPDLGAGVWLYGPTYFAGISAQSLMGDQQVAHLFATAGYKVFLAENVAAIPSFMVKYLISLPTSVDVNLKLAFKDKFWIGGSYRQDDAIAAMAGFNISSLFNLSYSYDFTTSALRSVSNGTHEIVLGLLLNNRYRVTCPQKNW
ncbi:type IX secretion system membrane protein PorP/SprF [Pedobacter sp. BS3]|uniref:PorP/SprF family type IX secretion system membrane protein n=1 Tax=Pedobacter sp. BS3 TaxID=2567937 RepID=UPI0011EE52BB|nr:type IX secretion system membrane protein PorP/SprF [Pedobacter sp. BS3]TZF82059.1 type IX secretion system membrane protein PorP/SprF [Pedobacter sp. BS3]